MANARAGCAAGALAAWLALTPGWAAGPAEPLDPVRAVELAVENHPMLAAASAAVDSAEADRALARSGYLPRLNLSESWFRSNDPVFVFGSKLRQGIFGPADFDLATLNTPDPLTNAATQISLEQNIWDADHTRLGIRAAGLGVEAASLDRRRTRDEIAFEALTAFWDAVMADQMLGVVQDAEGAARGNLELTAALVDEGLNVPSDRMSAEVRLAEVCAMRIRAQTGRAVARAALNRALGQSGDRTFELQAGEVQPAPPAGATEALVAEALAARAGLRAMDLRIEQARLGEQVARRGRLPTLGAGAQYELNGENPLDPQEDDWTVGLSLRVPLFDGQQARSSAARARAERLRAEALRQALAQGIELEVRAALAQQQSAAERLSVARSALELATETARIVRERYQEGLGVIVELLGADAARTQAQASRVQALRDLALAQAGLDLALGRPVVPSGAQKE